MHGDEARAEALDAGIVLVAVGLVDGALAAELGLDRLDRDAVRFLRAVAAALAYHLVDEDALGRVGELAALAAAALLGGAGLVVDDDREARHLPQLALHRIERVAMTDLDAGGEAGIRRILVGLVGDDDDALGALGCHLLRDLRHRQVALDRLAAGHRHRVVVKDLVGDVDAGGGGGADRQETAIRVGAVAAILEDVALAGEGRRADPVGAFGAPMPDGRRVARRHIHGHGVAADAGHGAAALGHARRSIVRAAGAEERRALRLGQRRLAHALAGLGAREALVELWAVLAEPLEPQRNGVRDLRRRQLARARQQRRAALVLLADD